MKKIMILVMAVLSLPAAAFNFWPAGPAPCNTTLQNCIDGSANGEYIEIRTNSTINENIVATGSKSLVPVMAINLNFLPAIIFQCIQVVPTQCESKA